MNEIGTLNEKPLHAALKEWYTQPGDQLEVAVDDFVIDIVRDGLLIEIQTGNFSAIKRKMKALAAYHSLRLVYPMPMDKWIVKKPQAKSGRVRRRKSPKHCTFVHLFEELVSFPRLLENAAFEIEALLTQEDEVWRYDGKRGWRRGGWVVQERRLVDVVERRLFRSAADLASLIPPHLVEPWTTADLAAAVGERRRLAQKMAYCLRKAGVVNPVGKSGNAILYVRGEGF